METHRRQQPARQKGDIKVGVIRMIDNGAFADMRDGFSEELTEKYTGGKVDIVYKMHRAMRQR